jgi:hypothetical protein
MAEPDVVGAVDEVGQVDDVATQLRDIGVVVSSSTRESFHLAVAEAVLSGALAVVRDWPALARFGGAHGVWPDSWIVTTPAQAAWRALDPDSERGGGLPVTTRTAAAFLAVLRGTTPTDDDLVPAAAPSGR